MSFLHREQQHSQQGHGRASQAFETTAENFIFKFLIFQTQHLGNAVVVKMCVSPSCHFLPQHWRMSGNLSQVS